MEQTIFNEEFMSWLMLGLVICLAFLWAEYGYRKNHPNAVGPKVSYEERRRYSRLVWVFVSIMLVWVSCLLVYCYMIAHNWVAIVSVVVLCTGGLFLAHSLKE